MATIIAIDRLGSDGILPCDLTGVHRLHEIGSLASALTCIAAPFPGQ